MQYIPRRITIYTMKDKLLFNCVLRLQVITDDYYDHNSILFQKSHHLNFLIKHRPFDPEFYEL